MPGLGTPRSQVEVFLAQNRIVATMFSIFGLVAVILASVGIYGVMSFAVSQRTQEFGVRMALGASAVDVGRLVITFGLRLAVIAALVGIPAALAFSRVLSGLLFGVDAANPVTYVAVSLVLVAVAALAALLPARRATRVDPLLALRAE